MKSSANQIVRVVSRLGAIDRLILHRIYRNAASVVAEDGDSTKMVVITTEGLRAVHVAIVRYICNGEKGRVYEDLRKVIDDLYDSTIGKKSCAMTPALRSRAVEMFDSIAWAGLGKDE